MAFEQDLRDYLEAWEDEARPEAALPLRRIDEPALHVHFLARMRDLERAGSHAWVRQLFEEWPGQLHRFARYLEMLPRQLVPIDPEGSLVFARHALDQAIGCVDAELALVDRLELQRVVAGFIRDDVGLERYALENRLVRHLRPPRLQLTELGRVFLRLRGKEAIRWLVTNEVVQNTGASDPWHASHDLLEAAATTDGITIMFEGANDYHHAARTLYRLTHLGLLEDLAAEESDVGQYRVAAPMRDVVRAVLEPGPWHTAVRALLSDESANVFPGAPSSATEATIEQTKLIAHEVRNALIPVRHDIDALRSSAMAPAQQQRIDNAKQGVVRVLEFVDAMVQMSELITEPSTRCEIGAVVEEALGWSDTGQRVERLPFPSAVYLLAPRARLARAIPNIVGNALQATTGKQPIRVSISRATSGLRIVVDDGGPGVPKEHRTRIFLEGVTMRQDGAGSGFGLAFARRVVEGSSSR